MKNNYLLVNLTIVLAIGIMFIIPSKKENERRYEPRQSNSASYSAHGAIEYMTSIRANQTTKTIDPIDVLNAQKQLNSIQSNKKSASSEWIFRGPDNVGGRTRAILIDNENSNLMFAGSVSGGLWKSTTGGQYWNPVEYGGATIEDFANLAVVSISQASNGDIYFGTGEGLYYRGGGGTGGILGAGIWKSTDRGETFKRLETTWSDEDDYEAFSIIDEVAVDPSNSNIVYAATKKGLRVSNDAGLTWDFAPMPTTAYNNQYTSDVQISSNGDVIASVGNKCMLKKAGSDTFELKSGIAENLISNSNIGRLEFAYADDDPNYVYCLAAKTDETLKNIYKSVDGGENWHVIGKGGSALFQPLGNQGIYDMCITVNPTNKEEVFIGGLNVWKGNKVPTGELFEWSQLSQWDLWIYHPLYIHADQHTIVFDKKDPKKMYIGSDGGVARGLINHEGIDFQFASMNKNYNVTQFYSVAVNGYGQLLGGTQDNGTILVPNIENSGNQGFRVMGGDGGHTAMSKINNTIAFSTMYYGALQRNTDGNFGDFNYFYNSDFADLQNWTSGEFESDAREAAFVTPIAYWETKNDPNSNDSVMFIAKRWYKKGENYGFSSHNIFKAPIRVKMDKDYYDGDTLYYKDPYSSLFAIGMKRNLWLTKSAANFNKTLAAKDWWRAIKRGTLSYTTGNTANDEYITQITFSADGNHLFFSTNEGDLYRLSNLNQVRSYDDADYLFGKNIKTELVKIGNSLGQTITGIASDPNNPDNLIVTLGNYNNSDYVYLCTETTTIEESGSLSHFTDITTNLPKAPAFCALFEMDESNSIAFVGTDMGMFKTDDVFASEVKWEPYQNGSGPVPVLQITQNTMPVGDNYGVIYIGTHGRGFFEDRNYVGISDMDNENNNFAASAEKISFEVYPNPIVDQAKIQANFTESGNLKLDIYNLNGQLIKSIDKGYKSFGENEIEISCGDLNSGAYILTLSIGKNQTSQRIIKK